MNSILAVDDSASMRQMVSFTLKNAGYEVVEAVDGEQALAVAAESRPDVILLDIEMPRMDGFEALGRLQSDPALQETPVVLVSGRTTTSDVIRGIDNGAHDYLRKPFEAAELAARVHGALRTKRLQDEVRELRAELARRAGA